MSSPAWEPTASWPVERGEEITAAHFEDIRKLIWCITRIGEQAYELPAEWNPNTLYVKEMGYYPMVKYLGLPYVLVVDSSIGIPPWGGPTAGDWVRFARPDRYCDYNKNSGCYTYNVYAEPNAIFPAYKTLPPQFNKYTQTVVFPGDGRVIPSDAMYGKTQETPVEFKECDASNPNDLKWQITGPIGTKYNEHHITCDFPVSSPFYYPYYVKYGVPVPESGFYDYKLKGYQSFVEAFVDSKGDMFQWRIPNTDLQEAIEEGYPYKYAMNDYHANAACGVDYQGAMSYHESVWHCNYSAFEKCLEIIDTCDWYLDMIHPPDPWMFSLTGGFPMVGTWRRTWRHSFGFPGSAFVPIEGGRTKLTMWPDDKGNPPFEEESYLDWNNIANAQAAFDAAHQQLTAADWEGLNSRHGGTIRANPAYENGYEWAYEITVDILNDMKRVLECLKYVTISGWSPEYYEHWAHSADVLGGAYPPVCNGLVPEEIYRSFEAMKNLAYSFAYSDDGKSTVYNADFATLGSWGSSICKCWDTNWDNVTPAQDPIAPYGPCGQPEHFCNGVGIEGLTFYPGTNTIYGEIPTAYIIFHGAGWVSTPCPGDGWKTLIEMGECGWYMGGAPYDDEYIENLLKGGCVVASACVVKADNLLGAGQCDDLVTAGKVTTRSDCLATSVNGSMGGQGIFSFNISPEETETQYAWLDSDVMLGQMLSNKPYFAISMTKGDQGLRGFQGPDGPAFEWNGGAWFVYGCKMRLNRILDAGPVKVAMYTSDFLLQVNPYYVDLKCELLETGV